VYVLFPTVDSAATSRNCATDLDLTEKARDGEVSAFETLVGRHHRAARRAALAALGSAQDADDVAQEAWRAVHARLRDFRGQASIQTWLLTIAWNKALDRRREVGRWLARLGSSTPAGTATPPPARRVPCAERFVPGERQAGRRQPVRGRRDGSDDDDRIEGDDSEIAPALLP
jgi:RNA polymerase sigma factor (sigma-70 family)